MYVIAIDRLTLVVEKRMQEGEITGIKLPNSNIHMCLQIFTDDTNALVANFEDSIGCF